MSAMAALLPRTVLVLAITGVIVGFGSWASPVSGSDRHHAVDSRSHPCGSSRSRHPRYRHVVWIVMENKSFSDVIGSPNAPFVNSLARTCGLATNFSAEDHPSLPNYIAMTSGSTQGVSENESPSRLQLQAPSIFSQLGSGWRALQESMPSPCHRSDDGLYIVHHNPVPYYANLQGQCGAQDVPLGRRPDISARFTFITPNQCSDMHDCPAGGETPGEVQRGDRWLAAWVPRITRTRQYRSRTTVLFITWDEGAGNQRIPTLVISPTTRRGTRSGASYNHYSLLRTTEELLGLGLLGEAASSQSMSRDFSLRR
jgi:phosphatidylinositol-3-phosphatase